MKKILLDTNAYVSFLAGDEHVLEALAKSEIVYMSVIVLGELYAGFEGGRHKQRNKNLLEKFLQKSTVTILDVSHETSLIFGEIKNTLGKTGHPIPINDVWITAHAVEAGSVLITYDRHFRKIPGLRIWDNI